MTQPVILQKKDVADILGCTPRTLRKRMPTLLEAGFPRYDEILRGFHRPAVEAFLSRRAGEGTTEMEVNWDAL